MSWDQWAYIRSIARGHLQKRAHGGVVTISFKTDFRQSTTPPPWRRQWNTKCSPRTTATIPPRCLGRRGCSRPSWPRPRPRPRVRPRRQRRRPPYPRRSSSRREDPGHTQRHAQGWWDSRVRNKSKPVYVNLIGVLCPPFLPVIWCRFTPKKSTCLAFSQDLFSNDFFAPPLDCCFFLGGGTMFE